MEITVDFIWKMILSAGLGAIFGIERAKHGQDAGIRTNMMISLASCLFTYIGVTALSPNPDLPPDTRIPAQIVIGVGFLGAGTLLQTKNKIRGLTTASTIWLVSAIGMAVGVGMYWGAIFVTVLSTIALILLAPISEGIKETSIEHFEAQKRYEKSKQQSDKAKQKRLEALRLWLELNHDHNDELEHQDDSVIDEE
jgi:putative Mg2+ transporter-C (MgtC) family protein